MQQDRHKRLYHLHSASGIWLGYFMYFVAITGCFALFEHEMQSWEDPARRITYSGEPVNIDATYTAWLEDKLEKGPLTFSRLDLPTETQPYYYGYTAVQNEGEPAEQFEARWSAATGEELLVRGEGVIEWLYGIHRDLNWPEALGGRTVGRALAGLAGVILLMSIISGILIHSKIFKEMFTMRYYRSVRLKWQDSHKVIGVWGIPVFGMFALTGAFLGIITLLAPATAFLTLKGDQEALIAAVVGEQATRAGISAPMLPPSEIAAMPVSGGTHGKPAMLIYRNWGDVNAEVEVSYEADTELAMYETYPRNAVTGEQLPLKGTLDTSKLPIAVVASYSALHYGTYGGIALKLFYLVMGLALSVMTGLGLMLWVERRLHGTEGQKSKTYYQRVSRTITGSVLGVPLATAFVLVFDRCYSGVEGARFAAIGWAYFAVIWAAIVYAFLRKNDYRTTRELLGFTGFIFALLPVLNFATTGGGIPDLLTGGHHAAGYADLALLIIGLITIWTAGKLPKRRPAEKTGRQARGEAKTSLTAQPQAAE